MISRTLVETVLIPHTAFEEAERRMRQCIEYVAEGGQEPACLALTGESRTGKSRCIKSILEQYPFSRTAAGIVAPVLAVVVPSKPTVKSLAEGFLYKLGAPDFDKGTETQKTKRLLALLRECGVLSLVLDEFHHFYDKTSHKVQHHVADWMKNIVSESGVALIACGLPSLQSVIDQNEQLAGRFGAPIEMPRFNWFDKEHLAEWGGILSGFSEVLREIFRMPELSETEMAFRLYCATGGLMGYLTNILRQALWNAVDRKAKQIRLEDLDQAYRQAIWAMEKRKIKKDELTPFHIKWNQTPTTAAIQAASLVGQLVSDAYVKANPSVSSETTGKMLSAR